jgi:hypothetical protein
MAQSGLKRVPEHVIHRPAGPNREFPQERCTDPLESWTIRKGSEGSVRQSQNIMWDMGPACHHGARQGPNSEFLQERCTDPLETWTIGKGSEGSARQSQNIMWDMGLAMPSWGPVRTE